MEEHPAAAFLRMIKAEDEAFARTVDIIERPDFMCAPGAGLDRLDVLDLWAACLLAAGISASPPRISRATAKQYQDRLKGEAGERVRLALIVANAAETKGAATGGRVFGPDFLKAVRELGMLPGQRVSLAPTKEPVQRWQAQEAAILSKLKELGIDPLAVPVAPAGKPSTAKQAVRKALGYNPAVMNKAWQRLRADGCIKDAPP